MPVIAVTKPIVDTSGEYQADYELGLPSEGVEVRRTICSQKQRDFYFDRFTTFTFNPRFTAPRLAIVPEQQMKTVSSDRDTKTKYIDHRYPAGQAIYDVVLASELLMRFAPDILNKKDYVFDLYSEDEFHALNVLRWRNRKHEGAFLYTAHQGKKDEHHTVLRDDEYLKVNEYRPESVFEKVHVAGVLKFLKRLRGDSHIDNLPALLRILFNRDGIKLSVNEEGDYFDSGDVQRKFYIDHFGIVLQSPDAKTVEEGVAFRESIEQFIAQNYSHLSRAAQTLEQIQSLILSMGQERFKTPIVKKFTDKNMKPGLESALNDIRTELRRLPNVPRIPDFLL